MKVIYFQPRTDAARNYRAADGTEQIWTPWWALLLHQFASKLAGDAQIIDARLDPLWPDSLAHGLAVGGVVLAVSAMTGHALNDAIAASQLASAAGATVVWGGPHATLFPDEVAALPYVDSVIRGFGAAAFERFLADLCRGSLLPTVVDSRGEAGEVPVVMSRRGAPPALFRPTLDLIGDWSGYVNSDHAIGDRVVNLVTSEGCLRRCTYCSEPATSKNSWLIYEVEDCVRVAADVAARAAADGVKLHDPNFLQDVARGLRFADRFVREVGLPWAATIHPADLLALPDADLDRLAASGLRRVLIGLESPDQELVKLAGKQFPVDRIPEYANRLSLHHVAGMFTFIVGWPGADPGHYQRTIDTAMSLRAVDERHQAKIHFLEPWPGTPIHRLMQKSLDLPPLTIEEWGQIDYYFAHHIGLHDPAWEGRVRAANRELSPYVDA